MAWSVRAGPPCVAARLAVAAHAATNMTAAARLGRRDVRAGSTVPAGSYAFEIGEQVVTGWHSHDLHQLEYAFEGVAEVETATARHLLPPQRAIWVPAGTEHCTTLTRVRTVSMFFDPAAYAGVLPDDRVQVIRAPPVLREMVLHTRRWPIQRPADDPAAAAFLTALAHLIADRLATEEPALSLPTSQDPLVAAAMRFTAEHLPDVTLRAVCSAVGASERTMRRAFQAEAGLSWRRYLLESRLLAAMAALAEPGPTVLAVATAVGFESPSGFVRAFRRYTGETPAGYRRRLRHG
jgi:AraC-like DNA-binding protein